MTKNESGENMIQNEIISMLFEKQDIPYRDFQSKLIPTVDRDSVIGVRTPELRALAKALAKRSDVSDFLSALPHRYFDENQLHAFIISLTKDFELCVNQVCEFLPFIDNWATCDQLSPKVFKKHKTELLPLINNWIGSGKTYTVRFGVGMLMEHFLDEAFDKEYPQIAAQIRSDEYYVNMMRAWYFATALAKQYEAVVPFIESGVLDGFTHNKAIQKAVESCRITPEQKTYLKTLKKKRLTVGSVTLDP